MALTIASTEYGYHVTGDTSGTIADLGVKLRVKALIFTPVNGANDAIIITDGHDRIIWEGVGAVQNDSFSVDLYETAIDGLKISSMTNAADILVVLLA